MKPYTIEFTHAALVQLAARSVNRADLEKQIRAELAEHDKEADTHLTDINKLGFHVVMTGGDPDAGGACWFCAPGGPDILRVDAGRFKEIKLPADGNFGPGGIFEGKKLMMPVPFEDDDDE